MGREGEEQPGRGFKVEDRRRFTETGSGEQQGAAERTDEPARAPEPPPADVGGHGAASGQEARAELAEMTFSTFVIGLTTQALVHLGEIADPADQQVGCDLPAAKQMIDLLGILRDKTKGNLDAAEEQLLGSMLYDLRMRYVEVARNR